MKAQIFIVLISVILCSQPFLRKLDDTVTEESCKNEGKKFQKAVSATCKVSDYIFDVDKKEECISGTWSKVDGCVDALEIEKKEECTGTPTFTEKGSTEATCILNGVSIKLDPMSEANCEKTASWTEKSCSDNKSTTKETCENKGTWTEKSCSDNKSTTKETCENKGTWTEKSCSDKTSTTKETCENKGTWTDGACSDKTSKTKEACTANASSWIEGICSDAAITTKDDCEDAEGNSWTVGACSDGTTKNKNDCTTVEGNSWIEGTCSDGTSTTKTDCEAAKNKWTDESCSDKISSTKTDCEAAKNKWTDESCSDGTSSTKTACEAAKNKWTDESCSFPQLTKAQCNGETPTYTPAQTTGECKLGKIVLSSRTTKATCEVALNWGEVTVCSYKQIKTEKECNSKAEFNEGTPAKCVESSSNFLKTATFVFFIICLLF